MCLGKGIQHVYHSVERIAYVVTDLSREVWLIFSVMMTGNIEEEHLILHSLEGNNLFENRQCLMYAISSFCSHLNSLVPVFNKVAREHFIDDLRSRADGETVVDMAKEFGDATLHMISMVCGVT